MTGCSRAGEEKPEITSDDKPVAAPTGRITVPEGIEGSYRDALETTRELGRRVQILHERVIPSGDSLRLQNHLASIGDLAVVISAQQKQIRDLNRQLHRANEITAAFQDSLDLLNDLILEKNLELVYLLETSYQDDLKLKELQENIYFLFVESIFKSVKIEDLKDELQAIYYTIGTREHLNDLGVLKKTGKIFSRQEEVSDDLDKDNFIRLHAVNTTFIPVYARRVKLLTQHPASSYRLLKEDKLVRAIEITDPERFWHTSRFLIIEVGGK